jgi:sulfofructose kinase
MAELVGIGAAVLDTLMTTEGYPQEDKKYQARDCLVQGGGPCATALVAASRLGISTEYLGSIGDDHAARLILSDFQRYGVEIENVLLKEGKTSFNSVVILNQASGSRTCIWHQGSAPSLSQKEVAQNVIKKAMVLHLDGHHLSAALAAARYAKKEEVKVCLDAGSIYPGIEELLPLVDLLIPSEEFACTITKQKEAGKAAAVLYEQYRPEIIVITQGSKGGIIYDGELQRPYPAFKVNVTDSNGAGDVFHGAFLAGYIKGMNYDQAAVFASATAAIKCTGLGTRKSIPAFEEVMVFLAEKGA